MARPTRTSTPTQGWLCDTPGLVVELRGGRIVLIHQDSGEPLAHFPTVDAARGAAVALGDLCDWTAPLDDLVLDRDGLVVLATTLELYRRPPAAGTPRELPPFEFHTAHLGDGLPPTDSQCAVATPGWSSGVDGLAVVWASAQVRLVHVLSGRAIASFPTLHAARSCAPFLLPFVAPRGWLQPFESMATDRQLWADVAATVAALGGGVDVAHDHTDELPDPELRCQLMRAAWSTCHDDLAVVRTGDGLVVAERTTGEQLAVSFDTVGDARAAAARLAAELDHHGMTPAAWAQGCRERQGIDVPMGPTHPRGA